MKSFPFFGTTVLLAALISIAAPSLADKVRIQEEVEEFQLEENPDGSLEIIPVWMSSTEYYADFDSIENATGRGKRHTPNNCSIGENCEQLLSSTENTLISDSVDPFSKPASTPKTVSSKDSDAITNRHNRSRSRVDDTAATTPATSNSSLSPVARDIPLSSSATAASLAKNESEPWRIPLKEEHSQLLQPALDGNSSDSDASGYSETYSSSASLPNVTTAATTTAVPDSASLNVSISESSPANTTVPISPTTPSPSFAHQSKFAIVTGLIIPLSMLAGTSMFV